MESPNRLARRRRTTVTSSRRSSTVIALAGLLLGLAAATPTAAQAVPCQSCDGGNDSGGSTAGGSAHLQGTHLVADVTKVVREFDEDIDSGVVLNNGDWIQFSATGRIWAGVWLTGKNGPNGWPGWHADNDSPLPGAAPFALLGKINADGYFFVGANHQRQYLNCTSAPGQDHLRLRINDDTPGNGSGAFTVHVAVYRPDNPPACP